MSDCLSDISDFLASPDKQFVFLDQSGRRWPLLKRLAAVALTGGVLAIAVFLGSLLVPPSLSSPLAAMKKEIRALQRRQERPPPVADPLWQRYAKNRQNRPVRPGPAAGTEPLRSGKILLGHFEPSDPESWLSLQAHAGRLTHIASGGLSLEDVEGTLRVTRDEKAENFFAENHLKHLVVLTNLGAGGWVPEAVEYLAFGPQAHRDRFLTDLVAALETIGAQGVLIDWQNVDSAYQADVTALFAQMAATLHAAGRELWLSVPVGDDLNAYDLPALAPSVDRFVAVLHDENGQTDAPGPIASKDWFEGWLQALVGGMDPSQWVVELGAYGYDWNASRSEAEEIPFSDVMTRADSSGAGDVSVGAPDFEPSFSYTEGGLEHTIWFLDAVTFANQVRAARAYGIAGLAVDRLGEEDPGIWEVLANTSPGLERIPAHEGITHYGAGEIVSIINQDPADGTRTVQKQEDGTRTERYGIFPKYPTLRHHGGTDPQKVALTFDDGPDPKWTPKILEILRAHGAKATFFVVGANAEKYPALLRRIVAEGHELGSHTFTHANLAEISAHQIALELNATQRVIEAATGRSTRLFRPPYEANAHPDDTAQLRALQIVQDMGYLVVFEEIDPQDWNHPTAAEILQRVQEQRKNGSILLLHDAGGDRSQTVAALPKIMDELRARGDRVVSVADLLGITAGDVMPPVAAARTHPAILAICGMGFAIVRILQDWMGIFILAATGLVALRTVLILLLAILQARRKTDPAGFFPSLSILIPAYKEEKVIAATIRSLQASSYPAPFEIVIIDDGSPDGTAGEVERLAATDPRVRLLSQPNSGKAAALERGVGAAAHEILVFLDADTRFDPETLSRLVAPLSDERVGAVAGHPRVGNKRTLIARCQDIEYVVAFNLERRALSFWNAVTVVPGAVSAFRRQAIREAGGFRHDTLAEDTDLTLAIHEAGWRIECAPNAYARTEAPETVATLVKQRFRWALGTLQCVWKHRRQAFSRRNPALGWFSLPGVWLFQFLLVAVAPLIDLLFLQAALAGRWTEVLPYFSVFLLSDLLLAVVACRMEGEKVSSALWMLPMRFVYRPILSFVVWKALAAALRGAWVGWGKLERTGSVVNVSIS